MTDPLPRKRFQIHLSTALVMSLVAGVLLWANTSGRHVESVGRYEAWVYSKEASWDSRQFSGYELPPLTLETVNGTESEFTAAGGLIWCGNRDTWFGWPRDAVCVSFTTTLPAEATIEVPKPHGKTSRDLKDAATWIGFKNYLPGKTRQWQVAGIVTNAFVAAGILLATCFLCEWLIRRRAARKGA